MFMYPRRGDTYFIDGLNKTLYKKGIDEKK